MTGVNPENRFSGRGISQDPAARTAARIGDQVAEANIHSRLQNFADALPISATQVVSTMPYRQQDARSCFYACLIGVAGGVFPDREPPDERAVLEASVQESLIHSYGAATVDTDAKSRQIEFVRHHFGLDIRFPRTRSSDRAEEIDALTVGMLRDGNPVLFGLPRHWIVLDGFVKDENGLFKWTGMNPAGGIRMDLDLRTVQERMAGSGPSMDVITIENPGKVAFTGGSLPRTAERSRMQGHVALSGQTSEKPRFSGRVVPAAPQGKPPRFSGRVARGSGEKEARFRGKNRHDRMKRSQAPRFRPHKEED